MRQKALTICETVPNAVARECGVTDGVILVGEAYYSDICDCLKAQTVEQTHQRRAADPPSLGPWATAFSHFRSD